MLILGASGSGKSTLALELIALGCTLVADDRVDLAKTDGEVVASAPERISGMIEARGLGILFSKPQGRAEIRYVVDLDSLPSARYPDVAHVDILGTDVEMIAGKGIYGLPSKLVILLRGGRFPAL